MDSLIRERNGKDEVCYSGEYLKQQIELAYRAGLHKGITVEFHSVIPMYGEMVNDLTNEFKKRIEDEYQKAFSNGEVVKWNKY